MNVRILSYNGTSYEVCSQVQKQSLEVQKTSLEVRMSSSKAGSLFTVNILQPFHFRFRLGKPCLVYEMNLFFS